MKVAIIAHVGTTNLGDEAVLAATLQTLGRQVPLDNICVYSGNPPDTRRRHGVTARPLRSSSVGLLDPAGRADPIAAPTVARTPLAGEAAPSNPMFGWERARKSLRASVSRIPIAADCLRLIFKAARGARSLAQEAAFVLKSWQSLQGCDLMVIAGSNQLEDWFGGVGGYPYTLWLWTLLGRSRGAKVAFVAVGAGPLRARMSQWLCIQALRRASFVSFRDAGSLQLMRSLGFGAAAEVVPDLAFALDLEKPPPQPRSSEPCPSRGLRIAINVFPFQDPAYLPGVTDGGKAFERYIDAIARFAVAAHERGHEPVLLGTQQADRGVLVRVRERIQHLRAGRVLDVESCMPGSVCELIERMDQSDAVVATRFHGILFGLYRQRPTLGLCYQEKSRQLLEMAGAAASAFDARRFEPSQLLETLELACSRRYDPEQARIIAELHARCRLHLETVLEGARASAKDPTPARAPDFPARAPISSAREFQWRLGRAWVATARNAVPRRFSGLLPKRSRRRLS